MVFKFAYVLLLINYIWLNYSNRRVLKRVEINLNMATINRIAPAMSAKRPVSI